MDVLEWPALGSPSAAPAPSKQQQDDNTDEWELLSVEDDAQEAQHVQPSVVEVRPINPKVLRHCASSPNLREVHRALDAVQEAQDDEKSDDDDFGSHVMVSATASIASDFSKISFRDAMMASKPTEQPQNTAPTTVRKTRIKPKIVVKPIKRCAKSTGDLQSLVIRERDEEVLGETDAMDYYHRKAMGAMGRANGMKVRPDEAKRKEISMVKKAMQRDYQRQRQGGNR